MLYLRRLRQLKYDEQMAAFKDDVDEFHRVSEGKNEVYKDENTMKVTVQ